MKIIETNVQQLLTGLAVVPRRAADQLRRWQNDRKVYPGSTKMGAARLYKNYVSWYAETFGDKNSALSLTVWGLAMKEQFKWGRGAKGIHYYVSRKSIAKMVADIDGSSDRRNAA